MTIIFIRRLILLVFSIILFSCSDKRDNAEQIIFDRIEYVYNLRSIVDENIWNGFDHRQFDLPLVYYTDTCCYIANPTEKFLGVFKPAFVFGNGKIKVYKTESLLDNIPFHMETGFSSGDTSGYKYKSPFMQCSSYELSKKTIEELTGSEEWAALVIHEYFHGFQFKHIPYSDYLNQHVAFIPKDSLANIYTEKGWFKEGVDKENDLLLAAINANNQADESKLVQTFFDQREKRRQKTLDELNFDIKTVEAIYETMEGTARYVEYGLYTEFVTKMPNHQLVKTDTSYHAYEYFRNFKLENEKWLYGTSEFYFYATGFNIARLLDKNKVEYKQRLFNESSLTLEKLLKEGSY